MQAKGLGLGRVAWFPPVRRSPDDTGSPLLRAETMRSPDDLRAEVGQFRIQNVRSQIPPHVQRFYLEPPTPQTDPTI